MQGAAAGALIGAIALRHPEVIGSGCEAIGQVLHGDHAWQVLALLESALRLVREWWPVVPVVHRADLDRLVGVLSLDDVLATYRSDGKARLHHSESPPSRFTPGTSGPA